MRISDKNKELLLNLSIIFGSMLFLVLGREGFDYFPLTCACLWLLIPILTIVLNHQTVLDRIHRSFFDLLPFLPTLLVGFISLCTLGRLDHFRNAFGHAFIKGFHHWYVTPEFIDGETVVFRTSEWNAYSSVGRSVIGVVNLVTYIGIPLFPVLTYVTSKKAVLKKQIVLSKVSIL